MINGKPVESPAAKVEPEVDVVEVDGKRLEPQRLVYFLLNKPVGYTTSTSDPHAEKLVTELVPGDPLIWPAGRLDKDTSGLLIMTNDGAFTQRLTHPSFEKEKEYVVTIDLPLSGQDLDRMRKGVVLEDGPVKPDIVEQESEKIYRIVVHEGRKRIIRRLIGHFKRRVERLERIRIGDIKLEGVKNGAYRKLTEKEIESVYQK